MYKVIIIDDERLARAELKRLLTIDYDFDIHEAATYQEAVQLIDSLKPDFIFLDVQLNGKHTGFDVLAHMTHLPSVIFTTAFNDYAIKAFQVNAIDYILKPMDKDRINDSVEKVLATLRMRFETKIEENYLQETDQVFVRDQAKCWFVKIQDIVLFERDNNYSRLYFNGHKPLIQKSLNQLEMRLNPKLYFRANRQQVFNLKKVVRIESTTNSSLKIYLEEDIVVVLSRRQAIRFREIKSL
jgi:two-component system, LytTR family, response regulator